MIDEMKTCTRCNKTKKADGNFYICLGKMRSECKACTILKTGSYQKKKQPWKTRRDENGRDAYMAEYYAKHKHKFAEYSRKFKERNPEYHKEHARKYKETKMKKNPSKRKLGLQHKNYKEPNV